MNTTTTTTSSSSSDAADDDETQNVCIKNERSIKSVQCHNQEIVNSTFKQYFKYCSHLETKEKVTFQKFEKKQHVSSK